MPYFNLSIYFLMHDYLSWDRKKIEDFSDQTIETMYDNGYVFIRLGNGVMDQTRSLRIDLENFSLNSENKRVLRKTKEIKLRQETIPYSEYHWKIHKLGKDFYDEFEEGLFSANKIKELLTNKEKSDFNIVLVYSKDEDDLGYCISLETENIIHYSYPFYNRENTPNNMGMGMIVKAVKHAQEKDKKYFYLGSAQRPGDVYKLQFEGLEWFGKNEWRQNLDQLKQILQK
ncbi:MAG: hypothetical protein BRC22_00860 [Parcubacteria group bacterium QH_9_35_7]|nr:MAG: hypothetical protein BRC22_00860 [Parcubacteria group bacterium QH_9_35_7]